MEEAQIVIDIETSPLSESMQLESSPLPEAPTSYGASLQHELDTLWGNANEAENFTIFRTPYSISQSKKNFFEPSVISIGPFHHGKKHHRALEEQKRRFLRDFLSRKDNISLDLCISEMKLLETRTRKCYSETFDDLDSDTFVEIMLLDGCFVLEYFSKRIEDNWESIREVGWNRQFIKADLLLQENQIPFFIVEKLYELIGFNQRAIMMFVKCLAWDLLPQEMLSTLILPGSIDPPQTPQTPDSTHSTDSIDPLAEIPDVSVVPTMNLLCIISDRPAEIPDPLAEIPDPPAEIHHLVHLLYHYLVPNPEKPVVLRSKSFDLTTKFSANRIKGLLTRRFPHSTSQSLSVALPNSTGNISSMVIPSATELKQKGVKFTPKSNPKHMLDISFEYGVLKIPRLKITDDTKPIFSNLIAFEQSKYGKKYLPFIRFVAFLDNLVNTPNDVRILQQCGIIENWLGSEEDFTHFINQATEGCGFCTDHYLEELYTEVNRYSESSWNRHRAKLIRDYFSSPWTAISLVAALILLVLTCVQSFYAVYAYKFPPSS